MARRGPFLTSSKDVDLLMLIREEAVYADRIREALVFSETKIERPSAPLVALSEAIASRRQALYSRPTSTAERIEEEAIVLPKHRERDCVTVASDNLSIASSVPFINPPINRRQTVDDNDALYSTATLGKRVEFNYEDLIATRENRKTTTVRALRRLANLWGINPKLNKEEMLTQLIAEYVGRYPDEVAAYESSRRSTTRPKKVRNQPRRR